MNIVGKILVILNLVFAVVTGGFLLVDLRTRTNWKIFAEQCQREMEVAQANSKASAVTRIELDREIKKLKIDVDTERQSRKDKEVELKAQIEEEKRRVEEAEMKTKESEFTAVKIEAEAVRLRKETQDLLLVIKKREEEILAMQKNNRDLRVIAQDTKRENQALQDRNVKLLEDYQSLMAQKLESEKGAEPASLTDANRANPPAVSVKGVIEKVDAKDPNYVEISLGSDQGIKKYNTLEVFRLNPRPEYLGTIRIMDVYNHKSVARIVRAPYAASRGALRAGDQVASKLGN